MSAGSAASSASVTRASHTAGARRAGPRPASRAIGYFLRASPGMHGFPGVGTHALGDGAGMPVVGPAVGKVPGWHCWPRTVNEQGEVVGNGCRCLFFTGACGAPVPTSFHCTKFV
jgi:hypothetical protein